MKSLTRHNPHGLPVWDPLSAWDGLFENFLSPVRMRDLENEWHMPSTDIRETKDAYVVTSELPGMKKDDIKVSLQDGVLTITAENSSEHEETKEGMVIRRERRYGKFMRRFSIGSDVLDDKVDATFEDGVLRLTIPKAQPKGASTPRTIDIH